MANDFSGDPNCVALFKFDNNGDDSKGGNDLTEVNSPIYDSSDKKEGTHCIDLEHDSLQYLYRADADLDAGFPGKNGTSEQSFSICGWVKPESFTTYSCLVDKFNGGSGNYSYSIVISNAGQVRFYIGYNSGASFSYITFDTTLSTGKWYHIAVVYDASDNSMKIRIWDDDAGALLDNNKEGTAGGDMSPADAELRIGCHYGTTSYTFDGKIDEAAIFNKVLTDGEIDQIRAGTYGAVTEKESSDAGSGVEASNVESEGPPQDLSTSESAEGADSLVAKIEMPTKGGGMKLWT